MFNKLGFNVNLTQSRIKYPDGKIKLQSSICLYKNKPRQIVKTYFEKKTDVLNDFDIDYKTKSYKTGFIFKKTHYYETARVIPKKRYIRYERTVTQYDDGSINYGDWRRIK